MMETHQRHHHRPFVFFTTQSTPRALAASYQVPVNRA